MMGLLLPARINARKFWPMEDWRLRTLISWNRSLVSATDKVKIHYKVMKGSWFIFSGVDTAGNIIYQKTVKKAVNYMGDPGTEVFQTVRISYPPSQQNEYKDYCGIIAKSF